MIAMMSEEIADPWQARLNWLRRVLPLPLLAVSTAVALASPKGGGAHPAELYVVGLPAAGAAAAVWLAATAWLRGDPTTRWRLALFCAHTALAAVLVWVNRSYGLFAYTGFLFAYSLGRRSRIPAFGVTSLIVAAALAGGYPAGSAGQVLGYLLIAVILMGLVMLTASITSRAVEQNAERGRMIAELAEAKARLEASLAENAELHAQLVEQAREAGITEERQRLAGEIHDTLAQGLTGIIAQLEAAEHTRQQPDEAYRHVGQARLLARSSLTEARRSVRALRPEQLEDASLPEAVAELARSWSAQSGVPAALEITGLAARAGPLTEAAVFRAAQEALSNVAKHADASRVQLTLTYAGDTLLLDVADDGAGFDVGALTTGYGLTGMRQRLARAGGTLTIESVPGGGTTLNVSVPAGDR